MQIQPKHIGLPSILLMSDIQRHIINCYAYEDVDMCILVSYTGLTYMTS